MSRPPRPFQTKIAFTLLELLAVIATIAILAGITIGSIQSAMQRAGIARARVELAHLAQGLEDFKHNYGDYPSSGHTDGAAALFGALTGTHGPLGSLPVGSERPVFIDLSRLTVERTAEALAGPFPADSAFLDPWDRRYLYRYDRLSGSNYLLYSAGPDRATRRSAAPGREVGTENDDDILADQSP